MNKLDSLKDRAYMVLCNLAFLFCKRNNVRKVSVYNIKNPNQKAEFNIIENRMLLSDSSMSDANTYKAMAILERNKDFILEGYKKWESIQKNA